MSRGVSLTRVRKLMQGIAMTGPALAMLVLAELGDQGARSRSAPSHFHARRRRANQRGRSRSCAILRLLLANNNNTTTESRYPFSREGAPGYEFSLAPRETNESLSL